METKDLIVRYGALFRKRYTKSQKIRFLSGISRDFSDLGFTVKAVKAKRKTLEGINLYVGNVTQAKTVIVAAYDTPSNAFCVVHYQPFNTRSLQKWKLWTGLIPFLVVIALGVVVIRFWASPLWSDGTLSFMDIVAGVVTGLLVIFAGRYGSGIPNPNNIVSNTSGVIACLELAEHLGPKGSTAFILTDYGFLNRFGEVMAVNLFPEIAHKQVIILDSVGGHGQVFVAANERSRITNDLIADSQSVATSGTDRLLSYQRATCISTGVLKGGKVICEATGRRSDTEMDMSNYENILNSLKKCIK